MRCRCSELSELAGEEAKTYADGHLEQVETRADGWVVVYRCAETDREWIEDYPRGEEHGGGPVRLRRT